MKKIPKNVSKAIDEFVIGVTEILGSRLKKIILYRSYARGDFNKNSDIDIMTLTDLTDKEIAKYRKRISYLAYDVKSMH